MSLLSAVRGKLGHSTDNSQGYSSINSPHRTGIEIAGVFIFIAVLAIAGAGLRANETNTSSSDAASQSAIDNIELEVDSQTPATPMPNVSANPSNNSATTSINSTTTSSGVTETSVTVNGEPVEVPNNGSTQQTINTSDGTTTVNISSQSTNSGSAHGYNESSSYIHSYSSGRGN